MQRVSSLVAISSVFHFKVNRNSQKHLVVKMLNLLFNSTLGASFSALRALLKKKSFIDELYKFPLLLFTACPSILNTRS